MDNKQLLANLLAQPEQVGPAHISMLQEMLQQHPYAQPLHLLLARANSSFISKAALYSNNAVLYRLIQLPSKTTEANEQGYESEQVNQSESEAADTDPKHTPFTEAEAPSDLYSKEDLGQAMSDDVFAFEQKLSTDVVFDPSIIETVVPDDPEINFVSKYDDDKLPYTFLWWLAKTRAEHEQIFQPYATPKPTVTANQKPQGNTDFQQQYVEHIFHIQTPFEVADHLAEYPKNELKEPKGAEIIEKFLKEDPTIKPPKPEQIDNENKAKKSAEDHYDLVSETLAKIYIEQMLYHKAIDTYKKLSLKYPEKSRYFADLIQSIEKKF